MRNSLKLNNKNYKSQDGAASMITVIFVAIILTVLTLGFVRLAVNEQRSSSDDDLTTRAYYAAESGVEDVKRALRDYYAGVLSEDQLNADICAPPDGYSSVLSIPSDYDIEYECMLIEKSPATLQYHIDDAYKSIYVPINSVDGNGDPARFNRMVIKWHVNESVVNNGDGVISADGGNTERRASTNRSLLKSPTWQNNGHPAMLRANIFSHPAGTYTPNYDNFVFYLNPADLRENIVLNPAGVNLVNSAQDGQIVNANCDNSISSGQYFCEAEIRFNGNSAFNPVSPQSKMHHLRLTTLYSGTHVEISLYQGNQPRLIDGVQAVADVTAKAGSVYRRVESIIELIDNSFLPEDTITSLTDICKDFFLTDDPTDFTGIDFTSCES